MPVDKKSDELYTVGIWSVKKGKENEFINTWTSFAEWTTKNVSGAGAGYLLQDEADATKFISYVPGEIKKLFRDGGKVKNFLNL